MAKEKRDTNRDARNKKRKETDTPLMEKLFGKKAAKEKSGFGWLKALIGGGLVLGLLTAGLVKFISDKVNEIPKKITDGLVDFYKNIVKVITGGEDQLKKDAEEEVAKAAGKEQETGGDFCS